MRRTAAIPEKIRAFDPIIAPRLCEIRSASGYLGGHGIHNSLLDWLLWVRDVDDKPSNQILAGLRRTRPPGSRYSIYFGDFMLDSDNHGQRLKKRISSYV